jgi:hypothetical protein
MNSNLKILNVGLFGAILTLGWNITADFIPKITTYECHRSTEAIAIDGRLDDVAWKNAVGVTALYEIRRPEDGGAKEYPDKVNIKLLYDNENLYIGAVIHDRDIVADPESPTRPNRESLFLSGDTFEIFIQPKSSEPVYYEYHINPFNAWWNIRYPARQGYMPWGAVKCFSTAKHAVAVDGTVNRLDDDRSWSVEIAIPLREITGSNELPVEVSPGTKWRISMCIYDYQFYFDDCDNSNALKYFSTSFLERIDFHERKHYNFLEFKELPKQ